MILVKTLLAVVLLGSVVGVAPASAAVAAMPAAGTMTFHADGSTGVTLTGLPESFPFGGQKDVTLELQGAAFALVIFDTGAGTCGEIESIICPQFGRYNFGGDAGKIFSTDISYTDDDTIFTDGSADIYIVADGPVTVTLNIAGLSGRSSVKLRGKVDAVVERLPVRCAATDCEHLRYGGAMHELKGPGGLAGAFTMSWNPPQTPVPGMGNYFQTNSIIPCAYPHWRTPDASPDPDAHPTGCDFVQDDGTMSEQHFDNTANFAIQAADRPVGNARAFTNFAARGEAYAGYVAERYNPFEPMVPGGGLEAFGVWLHDGITCAVSSCVVAQ